MTRLTTYLLAGLVFVVAGVGTAYAGWNPEAVKNARQTIARFKAKDPKLDTFFRKAYGYAVFPTIGKGAMGIGGAYGDGVVFAQGKPIGATSLTQITFGFQLGGQAYSEVIFFKDRGTLEHFKKGNFELGAQASAVAVTAGAAANADYSNGVAISRAPLLIHHGFRCPQNRRGQGALRRQWPGPCQAA